MTGINGVESVVYGVEDLDLCIRYFVDFGLPLIERDADHALFELEEGSSVTIRRLADARVDGQRLEGFGVQQVIWGVPDRRIFDRVVAKLEKTTTVTHDADGTARFLDGDGDRLRYPRLPPPAGVGRARPSQQLRQRQPHQHSPQMAAEGQSEDDPACRLSGSRSGGELGVVPRQPRFPPVRYSTGLRRPSPARRGPATTTASTG